MSRKRKTGGKPDRKRQRVKGGPAARMASRSDARETPVEGTLEAHYSPQQAARIREALEERPRGTPSRINVYGCRSLTCAARTTTVDRDEGVTPFMIRCPVCEDEWAQSSCYRPAVEAVTVPTHEWYAPTHPEAAACSIATQEHVAKGGLLLREIRDEGGRAIAARRLKEFYDLDAALKVAQAEEKRRGYVELMRAAGVEEAMIQAKLEEREREAFAEKALTLAEKALTLAELQREGQEIEKGEKP